ncbi:MAG: enolase C-terminal domain-like protein [Saprospiraceae bacterium]
MKKPTNAISRRTFVKQSGAGIALTLSGVSCLNEKNMLDASKEKNIQISRVDSDFEREPLAQPFGFKGGALTNIWQTMAYLESESGQHGIGLGAQSVLWSDASVFAAHTQHGGNALMYAMSERALQMIKGQSFTNPIQLLDDILEEVYAYGKQITLHPNLRKTFALNALVGFDNAAWVLYAKENGLKNFDDLIPASYKPGLSARHAKVVAIPALSYGTPMETIKGMADQGFFIMKIKIGAPGTQAEMLEKDKAFIKAIHETIGHYETEHSPDGKIPYYFDANGRYDKQETLQAFLDYADKIGALGQIAVLEEPFGERNQDDVRDIAARGPRVAADESAHTDVDALARIQQGYNAIAVKAVAKTLSMTMKIAQVAYENNTPCFCADLTVNPILVEWNKCVAARLPAFPGLDMGLQETNGWQNYRDWEKMKSYHPMADAGWVHPERGVYLTGADFFAQSGGILTPSSHYENMFSTPIK